MKMASSFSFPRKFVGKNANKKASDCDCEHDVRVAMPRLAGYAPNDCFILIYYTLREKNDKKTSCFNDLFISRFFV